MSTPPKSFRSVALPVAVIGAAVIAAACAYDGGPSFARRQHAWLPGATHNRAVVEANPVARIHSAGLKDFIARHKVLRKQFKGRVPKDNICGALLASVESQLPAIEQTTRAQLSTEDRRVLFAVLIGKSKACAGRVSEMTKITPTGPQRMTVFNTPYGQVEELVCDEEPEDECLSDEDGVWQALMDSATAIGASEYPASATRFSTMVNSVSNNWASGVNAADLVVVSDVGSVAVSSESDWPTIAEELSDEIVVSNMSMFHMPRMAPRAAQTQGFDPCRHLYDDSYLDDCRMKIFTKGVAADVFGGAAGVLGEKLAKKALKKKLAKLTARAVTSSAAIMFSAGEYWNMFEEYVLDM